jgi:hypothetical protein
MNRRERYVPMEYKHKQLMKALNVWCICLKVWLHPEQFGPNIEEIKQRYPKPDVADIDLCHHLIHKALSQDAKPMVKY